MLVVDEPSMFLNNRVMRFSTKQYSEMIHTGIIREGSPYELLDGILVAKDRSARGEDPMSIGKLHNLLVQLFGRLNADLAQFGCSIQTQGPIELSDGLTPEPDGAIILGDPDDYGNRLPNAQDVFCVIEVSDASLSYDRSTKLRIYATAAVPQYVIANLVEKQFEVFEIPQPELGRYAERKVFGMGQSVPFFVGNQPRYSVAVSKLMR